jgi:hypothetical protein
MLQSKLRFNDSHEYNFARLSAVVGSGVGVFPLSTLRVTTVPLRFCSKLMAIHAGEVERQSSGARNRRQVQEHRTTAQIATLHEVVDADQNHRPLGEDDTPLVVGEKRPARIAPAEREPRRRKQGRSQGGNQARPKTIRTRLADTAAGRLMPTSHFGHMYNLAVLMIVKLEPLIKSTYERGIAERERRSALRPSADRARPI